MNFWERLWFLVTGRLSRFVADLHLRIIVLEERIRKRDLEIGTLTKRNDRLRALMGEGWSGQEWTERLEEKVERQAEIILKQQEDITFFANLAGKGGRWVEIGNTEGGEDGAGKTGQEQSQAEGPVRESGTNAPE